MNSVSFFSLVKISVEENLDFIDAKNVLSHHVRILAVWGRFSRNFHTFLFLYIWGWFIIKTDFNLPIHSINFMLHSVETGKVGSPKKHLEGGQRDSLRDCLPFVAFQSFVKSLVPQSFSLLPIFCHFSCETKINFRKYIISMLRTKHSQEWGKSP
jgi:hypothetical protein